MRFLKKSAFLANLQAYQRTLLTLLSFFLILSMWFFFIHAHIKHKIADTQNTLHSILKKKHLLETSKEKCKKISEKISNMQYHMHISAKHKDLKTHMLTYAKSSGIELKSYAAIDSCRNRQKASYEFTGNISQALAFCKKIKKCNAAMECTETSLTTKDGNNCSLKCILEFLLPY